MKIQIGFHAAQRFGEMTANEVTVDADRLVLLSGGEVVLDVPTTAVAETAIGPSRKKSANNGQRWTAEADAELTASWEAGVKIPELSRRFERSRGAIKSRLVRLGLADADEVGARDWDGLRQSTNNTPPE